EARAIRAARATATSRTVRIARPASSRTANMTVSRRSVARILVRGSSRWIAESTGTYWPRTSPLKNSTAADRERLEDGDPRFLDGEDIPPDGEAALPEAAGEQGHLR